MSMGDGLRGALVLDNGGSLPSSAGRANWAVLAATSREDAERYSSERGLSRPLIRSKAEVLADPLGFRRELRSRRIDVLAVHSRAWRAPAELRVL